MFLQDAPQVDPNEVRAVFQRAVVVPTEQLDLVWSRYTRFENELNETMAPKIERSSPSPTSIVHVGISMLFHTHACCALPHARHGAHLLGSEEAARREERLASRLASVITREIIRRSDFGIDLHTGSLSEI